MLSFFLLYCFQLKINTSVGDPNVSSRYMKVQLTVLPMHAAGQLDERRLSHLTFARRTNSTICKEKIFNPSLRELTFFKLHLLSTYLQMAWYNSINTWKFQPNLGIHCIFFLKSMYQNQNINLMLFTILLEL